MIDELGYEVLPDNSVRIVMWGKDYDVILYDRLFTEVPTIEQLRDIRNASKVVFEDPATQDWEGEGGA